MAYTIKNVRQAGSYIVELEVDWDNGEKSFPQFPVTTTTDEILTELSNTDSRLLNLKVSVPQELWDLKDTQVTTISKGVYETSKSSAV